MTKGRLTRQELGWLLTQEAQGAAERLKKGVQALKSNMPPPPVEIDPGALGVDSTIAALDDAMRMLSSLHQRPVSVRGRRGRIDLAALLWEVAPEARVSIEPGGTEVFGDEAELRRMLHVLIGHGSGSGSAVAIRRDGDTVRCAVTLGPDSSATADTERAWLGRMAIRYGGTYELESGMEVLSLPADGIDERDERAALRKELDEARKQGEAYARELAQVVAQGDEPHLIQSSFPPPMGNPAAERVGELTRFAGGVAAELRAILSPLMRELQELKPANPHRSSPDLEAVMRGEALEARLETMKRRLLNVHDFVAQLAAVGELEPEEPLSEVDLVDVCRSQLRHVEARAQRSGVVLRLVPVGPERAPVRGAPRGIALLVRGLIEHAVAATPRGQEVVVTVGREGAGTDPMLGSRVIVDDMGTMLPSAGRRGLLTLEVEPGTYGRPCSIPLHVASEIASLHGAVLEIADSPTAGVRVSVTFSR